LSKLDLITKLDYFLIGGGILTLPIGIGLILIGISLFRIGNKWQKINDENQRELDEIDAKIAQVEKDSRPDFYDLNTLEEMK